MSIRSSYFNFFENRKILFKNFLKLKKQEGLKVKDLYGKNSIEHIKFKSFFKKIAPFKFCSLTNDI